MRSPDIQVSCIQSDSVPTDVSDRLHASLRRLVAKKSVPHALIAIETGDRSFRWIAAAGKANPDGPPMQPETPFFIASVTKLYIATTVMLLREAGLVDLDQPLISYLPTSRIAGIHRMGGVDFTARITVRNLLAHTSGLADFLEDRPKRGPSLAESLIANGDRSWGFDEVIRIVRDDLKPHFPPQPARAHSSRVRYSDTNYQMLLGLIETVTAQPVARVFEEKLFRPLGLVHTYLPGLSQPLEPTPAVADLWSGAQPLKIPLALQSLYDLISTAEDNLAFLRALIGGRIFRDPVSLLLMQEKWNRFGLPMDAAALRAPSWPIEYGLGIMRFRLPRLFTPFAPLPSVIGHSGSTGTWLFYCPQLDLYMTGTVDQVTAGAIPFRFVPEILRIMS